MERVDRPKKQVKRGRLSSKSANDCCRLCACKSEITIRRLLKSTLSSTETLFDHGDISKRPIGFSARLRRSLICVPLSKDDGYGNENVIPKHNLALSQVFRDYSVLFTLYITGEPPCNWMGTNGFKVKTENDCFIVICSRCRQNLKFGDFTLLLLLFVFFFLWSTAEKGTEIRVSRAARVFFLF